MGSTVKPTPCKTVADLSARDRSAVREANTALQNHKAGEDAVSVSLHTEVCKDEEGRLDLSHKSTNGNLEFSHFISCDAQHQCQSRVFITDLKAKCENGSCPANKLIVLRFSVTPPKIR